MRVSKSKLERDFMGGLRLIAALLAVCTVFCGCASNAHRKLEVKVNVKEFDFEQASGTAEVGGSYSMTW